MSHSLSLHIALLGALLVFSTQAEEKILYANSEVQVADLVQLDFKSNHYEIHATTVSQLKVFPEDKKSVIAWRVRPKITLLAALGYKPQAQTSTAELLRLLQARDSSVRRRATDTIRSLGLQADPQLVSALATIVKEDPDQYVVIGAIYALAETGGQQRPMVISALQKAFVRSDSSCGKCFADAFKRLQAPDALRESIPDLLRASTSTDSPTQHNAIRKLAGVGSELPESAIVEVIARLRSKNAPDGFWDVLSQAAPTHPDLVMRELIQLVMLGHGGSRWLSGGPLEIARRTGSGTRPIIAAARPELVKALKEGDKPIRYFAAGLLGMLGTDSLEELMALASSNRMETREAASDAIVAMGEGAILPLIKELSAIDDARREVAIRSLTLIRPSNTVVSAMMKVLAEDRARVRDAARVLGQIGGEAKLAEPLLLGALGAEKDTATLSSIIWALGKLDSATAVPKLLTLLRSHPEASVRSASAEALARIHPITPSTILALIEATSDKSGRSRVSTALRNVGLPALPILARAMSHPNDDVRWSVISDIGAICQYELTGKVHRTDEGPILQVVEAIGTISSVLVPKLAECDERVCTETFAQVSYGIGRFHEDVIRLIEDRNWTVPYNELNWRQSYVIDKILIAVAKAVDSIPENADATTIRKHFIELASALISKYPRPDIIRYLTSNGISNITIETLGLSP
jgi:HEAT repeat protein